MICAFSNTTYLCAHNPDDCTLGNCPMRIERDKVVPTCDRCEKEPKTVCAKCDPVRFPDDAPLMTRGEIDDIVIKAVAGDETQQFGTGAQRSADTAHLDFASLPMIGLLAVARTASEGASKYGRLNYMQGMPAHDTLNHTLRHIVMYLAGDRSEPHLAHGAWGLLAAIQGEALNPDISRPHLLGPGATLTGPVLQHLAENRDRLAAERKAGKHARAGEWTVDEIPEVARILEDRNAP